MMSSMLSDDLDRLRYRRFPASRRRFTSGFRDSSSERKASSAVRGAAAAMEPIMGIPFGQALTVGAMSFGQHLRGRKRYPLVLMLEPLFRCNLACAGCGKIDYPDKILDQRLSVADCMQAIDECGAPVVVLAGGEPLLHRELPRDRDGRARQRQICHRLHQRAADGEEARAISAAPSLQLVGASRWRQGDARQVGLPDRSL